MEDCSTRPWTQHTLQLLLQTNSMLTLAILTNTVTHQHASYLLLRKHLLDANGLHGCKGLSPFQKALRDRLNFFAVKGDAKRKNKARNMLTKIR